MLSCFCGVPEYINPYIKLPEEFKMMLRAKPINVGEELIKLLQDFKANWDASPGLFTNASKH